MKKKQKKKTKQDTQENGKNTDLLIAVGSLVQDYKCTYKFRLFYRIFKLNIFYLVPQLSIASCKKNLHILESMLVKAKALPKLTHPSKIKYTFKVEQLLKKDSKSLNSLHMDVCITE